MTHLDPQLQRRVVIENVRPSVDDGRFPIKRTVGERVVVSADVFADGHDVLAAVLLYRRGGERSWRETPMAALGNDRWQAQFVVDALGTYEYTVEGWIDRFASWRHGLSAKIGAGQDVSSELLEGGSLVEGIRRGDALASCEVLATRGSGRRAHGARCRPTWPMK
jgi:starch synthase (maltosyl-transferring)